MGHRLIAKQRTRVVVMFLLLIGMATALHPLAWGGELENKVKTAYIYNFTKFIDWPVDTGAETAEPIKICFFGSDPLRTQLGELNNRQARGRSIKIVRIKDVNAISPCNMIFISRSEERQLSLVLERLQGTHVLTVSDIPQFSHKGGMIGFVTENERVKVEVNQRSVRLAGLKVSAKLLEIARVIP